MYKIHKIVFSFLLLAFSSLPVRAEIVEDHLALREEPSKSWLVLLDSRGQRLLPASTRMVKEVAIVSSQVPALEDEALIAAIALTKEGAVVSSVLHSPRNGGAVAEQQARALKDQISELEIKSKELDEKKSAENARLRLASGLAEVDLVVERINKLEMQLQEARSKVELAH